MTNKFHKFKSIDPVSYPLRNKGFKNLRGEKWKHIPGYEDAYMVSNLGRVKSLERDIYYSNGKIIHKKEQLMSGGLGRSPNYHVKDLKDQINITLYSEGAHETFSIRRLVYHCFVEPIDLRDHSFTILCKDGIGLNLHYKNLRKATRTEVQQRIYAEDRSISAFSYLNMKAIAQKAVKKRMRQITQYDLKGRKLRVFEGIKPAADAIGCKSSLIGHVLKGLMLKTGKYIFRYGDGPKKIDLNGYWDKGRIEAAKKRWKKVTQYNLEGERIAIYDSVTEASRQTGALSSHISSCINSKLGTSKGFIWRSGEGRKKISIKNLVTLDKSIERSRKKVAQYTTSGKLVAVHASIVEAGKAIGIHHSGVSAAARGVCKTGGGYCWSFVNLNDRQTKSK